MSATLRNNVRVSGHGSQPMLFAHGFGCDQNMWRLMTPAFEARLPRGRCSITSAPAAPTWPPTIAKKYGTLDGYATDVLEICDELDLDRRDFRGALGERDDRRAGRGAAPERFKALVLVGPSPRYINDDGLCRRLLAPGHRGTAGLARQQLPRVVGGDGPGDHGQRGPAGAGHRAGQQLLPDRSGDRRAVRARHLHSPTIATTCRASRCRR